MQPLGYCKQLGIGSLPEIDANKAWLGILYNFPDIPFWPQLPKRSYLENMYLQFSELIPGRVIDQKKQRFFIDKAQNLQQEMEEFYNAYLSNEIEVFKVSREYCEGIYSGLELYEQNPGLFEGAEFIKGQITGPISFGLQVIDNADKPILYDEMLHDILVKNLQRKAQWQEQVLSKINENVIISVDEPYLSSVGSGFLNLNRQQVIDDLETVFQPLKCIKATHCCGNTDWSLLMETSADLLLFDAFNYSKNFVLFASAIKSFLARGGLIGWGIVPTTSSELHKVNQKDLIKHLEDGISKLADKGLDRELVSHQSLITPACGMGNLSVKQAEKVMTLTKAISDHMRVKYSLE